MRTQTAAKTGSAARLAGKVDEQLMEVGMATLGLLSCAIGGWALVSLVSGMVVSGGPLALAADWLKAIMA